MSRRKIWRDTNDKTLMDGEVCSSQTQALVLKVFTSACKNFEARARSFGLVPGIASGKGRTQATYPLSQTSFDAVKKVLSETRGEVLSMPVLVSLAAKELLAHPILRALIFSQSSEWWGRVLLFIARVCMYLNIAPPIIDDFEDYTTIIQTSFDNFAEQIASYLAAEVDFSAFGSEQEVALKILSTGVIYWMHPSELSRLVEFASRGVGMATPLRACCVATKTSALRESLCITRSAISALSSRRLKYEESVVESRRSKIDLDNIRRVISELPQRLANALAYDFVAFGVGVCVYECGKKGAPIGNIRHAVIAAMAIASAFFSFGIHEVTGGRKPEIVEAGVAVLMRISATRFSQHLNNAASFKKRNEVFVADDRELSTASRIAECLLTDYSPKAFFGRGSVYEILTLVSASILSVQNAACGEHSNPMRAATSFVSTLLKIN